jgi:hypothetical protein
MEFAFGEQIDGAIERFRRRLRGEARARRELAVSGSTTRCTPLGKSVAAGAGRSAGTTIFFTSELAQSGRRATGAWACSGFSEPSCAGSGALACEAVAEGVSAPRIAWAGSKYFFAARSTSAKVTSARSCCSRSIEGSPSSAIVVAQSFASDEIELRLSS